MKISLNINYRSRGINVHLGGTFPLNRRTHFKVALDWINEIKKEMDVEEVIEVLFDGDKNITEEVKRVLKVTFN